MQKSSKTMVFVLVLAAAFAVTIHGQSDCKRHVESAGGFSYCPPEGWTSTLDNKKMFLKFTAPRPMLGNFNVKTEPSTAPLGAYVDAGIHDMITPRPGTTTYKLVWRGEVVTDSKMRGVRAVFSYTLQNIPVQAISYMFNGKPGNKLVITCSAIANDTVVPRLCDEMIRTFRLER